MTLIIEHPQLHLAGNEGATNSRRKFNHKGEPIDRPTVQRTTRLLELFRAAKK